MVFHTCTYWTLIRLTSSIAHSFLCLLPSLFFNSFQWVSLCYLPAKSQCICILFIFLFPSPIAPLTLSLKLQSCYICVMNVCIYTHIAGLESAYERKQATLPFWACFNMMIPNFIPFPTNDMISLWMSNTPLCTHTTFSLFSHQLKSI
jgi:hypothetical protein